MEEKENLWDAICDFSAKRWIPIHRYLQGGKRVQLGKLSASELHVNHETNTTAE